MLAEIFMLIFFLVVVVPATFVFVFGIWMMAGMCWNILRDMLGF